MAKKYARQERYRKRHLPEIAAYFRRYRLAHKDRIKYLRFLREERAAARRVNERSS